MRSANYVETQVDSYLDECDADEKYAEKCQAWVDEQMPELMTQAQNFYCIELPNAQGKHSSTCVDEILTDNDSQRYYKCMAHMLNDDADSRERFGRQAIFTHLEECLDTHLTSISHQHVNRYAS